MNREKPMNEYLEMLEPLLNASNFNTGFCQPSSYVKNADHMAVLLDAAKRELYEETSLTDIDWVQLVLSMLKIKL